MVIRLFHDINLPIRCKPVFRTHTRAHANRVGVVMAELYSTEERSVLDHRAVHDTLSEINSRQADVDQKMMGLVEGLSKFNDMIKRCGQYSGIS